MADEGLFNQLAMINVWAAKAAPHNTSQRCFGIAGVGAAVPMPVLKDVPDTVPAQADQHHQQGSEARRNKVKQIVEPGGKPAKAFIAIVFIADH
tara:strand:+ start:10502 stop:10783 length:282 start_codon:yes stop_codon:yes gene_type:complete